MIPRRMSDVAGAVGGMLIGEDVEVTTAAIDSREVVPGALFVALPGERVDGGRFVPEAFERGASGVLVRDGMKVDGPAVFVRSTNEALLKLAGDERSRSDATVVAVTGANGKTSTKDMCAAALATSFATHASPASFNNEIGLPMTLLSAPAGTQVVVAEMGARHAGDVRLLCQIARPQVAVVTNVGVAHLELFGTWDQIVESSAEPVEALGSEDVAVLNADDHIVVGYADRCAGRIVSFGVAPSADVRAESIHLDEGGCARFDLLYRGEAVPVSLGVPGEHMVSNALAAAAVALTMNVSAADCAGALSEVKVSRWRMDTFTTPQGVVVVNDAYNASPESMAAAIRAARWMARGRHLIAVLGPMAELGSISEHEHERIGELAARVRVDRLITVGEGAKPIAAAGLREGVEPDNVAAYDDPEEALEDVRRAARPGDVVLFKASRVAGLEKLAEALR